MNIYLWILVVIFVLGLYGVFIEPRWFRIRRFTIRVKKPLPRPLRILHLSDIHFHPRNTFINKLFSKIEKLKDIDLVILTGDIIDNDNGIPLAKEQLGRLKPKLGFFAVLGNHDHYWYGKRELMNLAFRHILPRYPNDIRLLKSSLESIGCHTLVNSAREVDFEGTQLFIAGLDDPVTWHDKPDRLPKSKDPNQLRILLVHLLDAIHRVKDHEFDLSFSGHTHGGQMRLPFLGPLVTNSRLKRKFAAGLHQIDGTQVFTSKGIGTSPLLPSRIFCYPEALVFTVRGSKTQEK